MVLIAYQDIRIAWSLESTDVKQFAKIYEEMAKRLRELNVISYTMTVPEQRVATEPQPQPEPEPQITSQPPEVEQQTVEEE